MCHQSVEKALKACHWFSFQSDPEYTHSLSRLARKAGLLPEFSKENSGFLDKLEPLNIEARYPTDSAQLASTRGLVEWLRQRYAR